MSSQPQIRLSPEEYLAAERHAETKSEYWDGEVLAMAGASYDHNLIVANVVGELRMQLKGRPCSVLPSDLRIRIDSVQRFLYPDATVVCGPPQFTDEKSDTIVNPTLIVEVLSKKTKDYDRGEKFMLYRTLPALKEYVLVTQDSPLVEHYVKQADGKWLLEEIRELDAALSLDSIACRLELAEVYDKVELPRAVLRPVDRPRPI